MGSWNIQLGKEKKKEANLKQQLKVKHVKQNSWATADGQSQYKQKVSIHRAKTFGKEITRK